MNKEKKMIEDLIMAMVDVPDNVRVDCTLTEYTAVYDVYVDKNDFANAMGKKAIHVNSLRTLFKAIYAKIGKRFHLQIVDPRRVETKK